MMMMTSARTEAVANSGHAGPWTGSPGQLKARGSARPSRSLGSSTPPLPRTPMTIVILRRLTIFLSAHIPDCIPLTSSPFIATTSTSCSSSSSPLHLRHTNTYKTANFRLAQLGALAFASGSKLYLCSVVVLVVVCCCWRGSCACLFRLFGPLLLGRLRLRLRSLAPRPQQLRLSNVVVVAVGTSGNSALSSPSSPRLRWCFHSIALANKRSSLLLASATALVRWHSG